jgi:hypothetical protein
VLVDDGAHALEAVRGVLGCAARDEPSVGRERAFGGVSHEGEYKTKVAWGSRLGFPGNARRSRARRAWHGCTEIDLLRELARFDGARVFVSVTTLDPKLHRISSQARPRRTAVSRRPKRS